MKKIYAAGAVLIDEKGRVYLIYKRARDEWALPKGKIKRGESELRAALREVREETGYQDLEVLASKPIYTASWVFLPKPGGKEARKITRYFLFRVRNGKQIKTPEMEEEGLDGAWFPFDEAIRRVKFDDVREVLRVAAKEMETDR